MNKNIEKDWEDNYIIFQDKINDIKLDFIEKGASEIFYDLIQKELKKFIKERYNFISNIEQNVIEELEKEETQLQIGNEYKSPKEYKDWLNQINGTKIISLENLSGFAKTEKILDTELWISYSRNEILTSIDNHLKQELDAKKTEEIATLFTYFRHVMSEKDKNKMIDKIYKENTSNLTSEELFKRVSNELINKINDNVESIGFPKPFDKKGKYKYSSTGEPDIVMITEEGKLVFTAANKYTNNQMESDQIIRHTTLLLEAKKNTKDFPSKSFHKQYKEVHKEDGSKEAARYLSEEVFKGMTEEEVEKKLNNEIIITFFQPKTIIIPKKSKVEEHFNYQGIKTEKEIKIHQRDTNSFIDYLTAEAQNINNEQIEINKGKEHIFNGFRRVQHNQTSKSYNLGNDIHKKQQEFFEKGFLEMLEKYDLEERLTEIHNIPNDKDYIQIEAINSILIEELKKDVDKIERKDFTKMTTNYHSLKSKLAQKITLSEDEIKQLSNYNELINKLQNEDSNKTFPNITTYREKIKNKQSATLLTTNIEYNFSDFEYRIAIAMNSSNPIREALLYTMSDFVQNKKLSTSKYKTKDLVNILLEFGKKRIGDLRLDKEKVKDQEIEFLLNKEKVKDQEIEENQSFNELKIKIISILVMELAKKPELMPIFQKINQMTNLGELEKEINTNKELELILKKEKEKKVIDFSNKIKGTLSNPIKNPKRPEGLSEDEIEEVKSQNQNANFITK